MNNQSGSGADSFQEMVERFYPRLLTLAVGITGDKEQSKAIVYEQLFKYRAMSADRKLTILLYLGVKHACVDLLRKRMTRRKNERQWVLENMPLSDENYFNSKIIKAELMQTLRDWVKTLPDKSRQVIEGLFFEGMSAKDLAQKLNIELSSVYNLKSYGLRLLRKLGKKHGFPLWYFFLFSLIFNDNWRN